MLVLSVFRLIWLLGSWLFLDYIHHLPLNSLLLKNEPILVPDEVWVQEVEAMTLHAALEQIYDVAVVWLLGEA